VATVTAHLMLIRVTSDLKSITTTGHLQSTAITSQAGLLEMLEPDSNNSRTLI